ncbi:hypothetical protein F5B22DRAFT_616882 [Xylaria bambusicola]|uniref:uncharacterized protein n=1 Tax=Xylaria bambusicola TaxID=326684 RepID=UPI00200841D9|nr:uncharacterized protein F5B22DRAFT_616882 [Xylaria bambusicola]KAI0509390.1 hypothetical protein F5B22DRAFT_616882 [Xylaria bambusicola]
MAHNRPSPPNSSDSDDNIGDPFALSSPSSRWMDHDLQATVETASDDSSPSAGPSSRRPMEPSEERQGTQPIPTPQGGRRSRIPHLEEPDDTFLFDAIEQRRHQEQREIAEAERLRRARQETHRWQDEQIYSQEQARRNGTGGGRNVMNHSTRNDENLPPRFGVLGEQQDLVPNYHKVVMQPYAHQYPHTNVQIGYDAGFEKGIVEGRETGFTNGYGRGYDHGFMAGLAKGRQEAPETAQIEAFITAYQKGFGDGFEKGHQEPESRRRGKHMSFASFYSECLTCI